MASNRITLEGCTSVSEYLDDLLKPSFGPNALSCMMSTATGRIIITSNGHFILGALNIAHPVGKLIVNAALQHHRSTGDQSKSFILMMTQALRCLSKEKSSKLHDEPHYRISMLRAFNELETDILQERIIPQITNHYSRHFCQSLRSLTEARKCVFGLINGSLQGKFNKDTRCHLAAIIEESVFSAIEQIEDILPVLQWTVQHFDSICIDSPGQSILNTYLADGVVIQRDFVRVTAPHSALYSVRFILIDYDIENCCPSENKTVIKVRTTDAAVESLQWNATRLKRLAGVLKKRNVKLILSTELISELFSYFLAQEGIVAVQCVQQELIKLVSASSRIPIASEDSDILDFHRFIGTASEVSSIVAGGKPCILLKGLEQRAGGSINKSLILSAPTPGICDQVAAAVLCCYKTLQIAFNNQNHNHSSCLGDSTTSNKRSPQLTGPFVCPVGGSFEMSASRQIESITKTEQMRNVHLLSACKIISRVLLSVPQRIIENSYVGPGGKSYVHMLEFSASNAHYCDKCDSEFVMGVEGKFGKSAISQNNVIEPLGNKISLLYSVIELIGQILKLDLIIPILRSIEKNCDDSEDE